MLRPAFVNHRGLLRQARAFAGVLAGLAIAGCATLPRDGPSAADIADEYHQSPTRPFVLVNVTASTLDILRSRDDASLSKNFGDYRPAPELTIGPGDGITVNIWETGTDTLFASSMMPSSAGPALVGGRGTLIPEQIVGADGGISVPFAGRIAVIGRTTLSVQGEIERALAGKAQKPQVLVNVSHPQSSTLSVIGEGGAGTRLALPIGGARLLDVLASSGGLRAPAYETWIQLTREDASVALPLSRVLDDPKENVFLRPGDDLIIVRQPQTFTVFGATGRSAQLNIDSDRVSLIEAVAKAGGLLDLRADPRGIFLFRYEPDAIATVLSGARVDTAAGGRMPVIYQIDLSKAANFFLAENFQIRDHDILYVSSSPVNQLQKFLQLLGLITAPVINGAVAAQAVQRN